MGMAAIREFTQRSALIRETTGEGMSLRETWYFSSTIIYIYSHMLPVH